MTRQYGEEYPERESMSALSDLLRIEHFTTSRGSTVRKDFLVAVGTALKVRRIEDLTKDELLAACVEAATRTPMPDDLYSAGSTVTDRAIQAIIDGVIVNGIPGAVPPQPAQPYEQALPAVFDPDEITDERDRRLIEMVVRQNQDMFRRLLLQAYEGRCAITGCDVVEALQAAHISPYSGPATQLASNGLLLRADIHLLFDRGSLAVHEETYEVLLKEHLRVTDYAALEGQRIKLPRRVSLRPSPAALCDHRMWAGL